MKPNSLLGKHLKKCLKKERKHFHVPKMLLTVLVVSAVFAAVPQKAFSSDTGGTAASTTAASTAAASNAASSNAASSNAGADSSEVSESSVRPLLEKYAAGLDTLYGKTYTAYLSKSKNGEFIDRQGFDSTEIPAVDAAWQIEDFDQDGDEELLVISVNDDSTLKMTMYEVTEGDRISAADTFDAAVKLNDSIYHVYAAEQGDGYTRVFTYDKDGPCIGFDSLGHCMQATGRRRVILTVKYDGTHFQQEGEPYYDGTSGMYHENEDEAARFIRGKFESFGTLPLLDKDVKNLFLSYPLDMYLPDVHEIMRTYSTITIDWDLMYEWQKKDNPEKIEACSIHFAKKNELYSTEIKERFSKNMFTHLEKHLSFCDETDHRGNVLWISNLQAFGEKGNLYQSGYYYVNRGSEDKTNGVKYEHNQLQLTFWETEEGIYLIPEMNEDEKTSLLDEGTLPEKAVLVYSESEQPDLLDPSAEGLHHSIEKYSGNIEAHKDIVTFREYRIPGKGQEACDFITIIWEKNSGLVGYESRRTSDGEDLIQVWNGKFIKPEDGRLIVD